MNYKLHNILLILFFIRTCLGYLLPKQIQLINTLLQNKNLTPDMRIMINKIIYNNYKNKITYDSNKFYQEHYKILKSCNVLKKDVLDLYAQTGLLKAINNFNGKSNFYNYSKIYVKSEILKCISEHKFNILPHRIKSSNKIPKYIKEKYNILYIGSTNHEDEWKYKSNNNIDTNYDTDTDTNTNTNKLSNINMIVENLDPKIKRTFKYRYDYNLKKIRSISHVSELMCWSTEKTRQVLLNANKQINTELNNLPK
jgi:hypothetical protein